MARSIRCRDLTCRFPGCEAPAQVCDIDHTIPYPVGPTHPSNLKLLCRFITGCVKYTQAVKATNEQVRAGCYCRICSDPKDKREGVDRQREDTAILCELKGWQVAGVYVDNDRSASNGKHRPEWERLLADIAAGKIDAVAAWDQDRVNRMMDDFQRYKKLFVQRGVLLATSNSGDIDLSTPSGVLTATIKTAVAEHDISMMKIRMRRAAKQKAERGIPKWESIRVSGRHLPARPADRAAGQAGLRACPGRWVDQ